MKLRIVLLSMMLGLAGCASTPAELAQPGLDEKAARANTQLGVAYMREGQLEQAMVKLKKALAHAPTLAEPHGVIAVLYERLGQVDDARRHYRRAVELAPQDSGILNNYGQFLCERGEAAQAQTYFERAVANPLYSTPEFPLANAGMCAVKAGDPAAAEKFFLQALRSNPRFAPALIRMARLRMEAGEPMSARGFYQRYLEVVPQSAESLWLGIQIERALNDRDAVASYSLLLRSRFPDSEEARRLLGTTRND